MNFLLRFSTAFLSFLHCTLQPIFWLKSEDKKVLPPITDDNLKISATDLARKIRKKELSSKEICEAYIKRIKLVNPILNAIVEERFEEALKEANNVDYFVQNCTLSEDELEKCKPLLGVPITVKESCSLIGHSLSVGSLNRIGIKADKDGEVVKRLKESGAIPLLISNTPELCLSWETTNKITGTTNNPYDSTLTSSGSSGGEGALLGAGASVIGIGSDVAGSIRLPAMFNGVFGHKPTARLIPINGHYPYCNDERYADFLVVGPLTRYAKDLKLMTKIMTGETASNLKLDEKVDLKDLKVFYMKDAGDTFCLSKVDDDIQDVIEKSACYLQNNCKSTLMTDKFNLDNCCEISGTVLYSLEDIPNALKGENQNLFGETIKCLMGSSKYSLNLLFFYTLQELYNKFIKSDKYFYQNTVLKQQFTESLGDNGVFLFPTFPCPAFKHNDIYFKVDGALYLSIFNSLGLPATHVPCGLNKDGLPIGFQVVAGPHQDRLCFAVAEELEKYFGGWVPPPHT